MLLCTRRREARLFGGLTWLKLKSWRLTLVTCCHSIRSCPDARCVEVVEGGLLFNLASSLHWMLNTFTVTDNCHCSFLSSFWTDFFLWLPLLLLVYWIIASEGRAEEQKIRQNHCKNATRGSCYISNTKTTIIIVVSNI